MINTKISIIIIIHSVIKIISSFNHKIKTRIVW